MLGSRFLVMAFAITWSAPVVALEVTRTIEVGAPPKAVWKTVGGFCGIDDWYPAVEQCVLTEGAKPRRTLSLKGGDHLVEEQQARDDAAMRYSYTLIDGPLPVSDYTATLTVTPNGSGARVTWTGTFKAKGVSDAEAERAIGGIYEAGLSGLADEAG